MAGTISPGGRALTIARFSLTFVALAVVAACHGPERSRPASNAGPAVARVPAPTPDSLLVIAARLTEAWTRGDTVPFARYLSGRFVDFKSGIRVDKGGLVAMVASSECMVRDWQLSDPQMAMIDPAVYVLSYQGVFDGECRGPDGETTRMLSPTRAASIFVRESNGWAGAFHSENRIEASGAVARRAPASAPPASLVGSASSAASGPNTGILARRHGEFWQALVSADQTRIARTLIDTFSSVGANGTWTRGPAAALPQLMAGVDCQAVRELGVSAAVATPIADGVELLTARTYGEGRCAAGSSLDRYHSAVYVEEAGMWRLAFLFDAHVN